MQVSLEGRWTKRKEAKIRVMLPQAQGHQPHQMLREKPGRHSSRAFREHGRATPWLRCLIPQAETINVCCKPPICSHCHSSHRTHVCISESEQGRWWDCRMHKYTTSLSGVASGPQIQRLSCVWLFKQPIMCLRTLVVPFNGSHCSLNRCGPVSLFTDSWIALLRATNTVYFSIRLSCPEEGSTLDKTSGKYVPQEEWNNPITLLIKVEFPCNGSQRKDSVTALQEDGPCRNDCFSTRGQPQPARDTRAYPSLSGKLSSCENLKDPIQLSPTRGSRAPWGKHLGQIGPLLPHGSHTILLLAGVTGAKHPSSLTY